MKRLMLAAGMVVALAAVPVSAEETATAQAVPVRYNDLDLNQADDAAALLSRLQVATLRACAAGAVPQPSAAERRAVMECQQDAMDSAVARIGAPELTRLHQARVQRVADAR